MSNRSTKQLRKISFSNRFKLFTHWLNAGDRSSTYARSITRKHRLAPTLPLKHLRLARVSDLDPSLKGWGTLSPDEKAERNRMLEVLRNLRKGASLNEATRETGVPFQDARTYLQHNLYKLSGRWKARRTDTIQRHMNFYAWGKGEIAITVTNSKDASLIGQYFADVRNALDSGDESSLQKFKNKTITDVSGKKHKFEIRLKKLHEIEDKKETPEVWAVYVN